jgi:hypothetical protein
MIYETDDQKRAISRWIKFVIQLNGAVDTGKYEDMTTEAVMREIRTGKIFDVLAGKLAEEVWTPSSRTSFTFAATVWRSSRRMCCTRSTSSTR